MSTFTERRILNQYPRGAYRWTLLLLTVLAAVMTGYEFQLAPILPLLLPYLHLSARGYAYFVSATVLISAASAFYGGPLADRYGRVVIIDACLAAITVLVFANLLIVNLASFFVIRTVMSIVGGLMAGAAAALVRDMSPRLSRALAFGLLTIGPVGSNYLATKIAAVTLPIFHTWQSQFWIMGALAVVMYFPILFLLKDLSTELRMQILKSEIAALSAGGRTGAEIPSSVRDAFARLLGNFEPWLIVIPFAFSLSLYLAIQVYGPLIFTEAFHYSLAEANTMVSWFWFANIGALIVVGVISDWLQVRKTISIVGSVLVIGLLLWWIPRFGGNLPRSTMAIVASTLGCFLAITSVPWAAQFSEELEDISPALQATGWAFYGLAWRSWFVIAMPLMVWFAAHYGWVGWIKFSLAGFVIYGVAMLFTHPRRRSEARLPAQPAPASVSASAR